MLPVMRAVQFVILAVVLMVGLPTLAHAHSSHDHRSSTLGKPVQLQTSTVIAPFAPLKMHAAAPQEASVNNSHKIEFAAGGAQHSVVASNQLTAMHACFSGCCCSGSSSCGFGSCCPTFISSGTTEFNLQESSNRSAHRLYHSGSLLLILGLDRPPKA